MQETDVPLCVDLDGTLVTTDLLAEIAFTRLRRNPLELIAMPLSLLGGKARFKARLAEGAVLDVEHLPYRPAVIELIEQARESGRTVLLVTAEDRAIAQQVADHLGLFDEVVASDGTTNVKGGNKAKALVERFGEKGFDYVGDCGADVPVWRAARTGYLAGQSPRKRAALKRRVELEDASAPDPGFLRNWVGSLRPHQWSKNLLVFIPLLTAHAWDEPRRLLECFVAAIAMCLCASGGYLINDLFDLQADRRHKFKHSRAIAAGTLSPWIASGTAILFVAMAITATYLVRPWLATAIAGYFVTTLVYSWWLKSKLMLDVVVLAGLYTMRIIVGAVAIRVLPSFWLLAFSMFIFLSLAMVKRYSELWRVREAGTRKTVGRGYVAVDLETLVSLGSASALMAVLVLALYVDSEKVRTLYTYPQVIWLLCPLLMYWLGRVWLITRRGDMPYDPVIFALTDRVSLFVAALAAVIAAFAI